MCKKIIMFIIIFFTTLSFDLTNNLTENLIEVFAYNNEIENHLENHLEEFNLEDITVTLDDGTSFSNVVSQVFSGNIDFSLTSIKNEIFHLFTYEFKTQKNLLVQLLLIVILSAMLKQVSQCFSGKSVGDMGFFVCYMVLVVVIITSFYDISQMVLARGELIKNAFLGMLPVFLGMCAITGGVTQSAVLGSSIIAGSGIITFVTTELIMPVTLLTMSMEMADNISEKPMLSRFIKLMKQVIAWSLKGLAICFMLLMSLQKISSEAVNNVAIKTAKTVVKAVPIVGDVMGGAVETMTIFATSLKRGTLVGVIIFFILLCLPILIKLLVIYFVFKIISAVAEFVCEERLVDCISSAGDYTGILLGIVFLIQGMFSFSAVLILINTN